VGHEDAVRVGEPCNSLQAIDPTIGKPRGRPIPVDDPYNLYCTPDGRLAIVVAERNNELDFRNARTFALVKRVPAPCKGVNQPSIALCERERRTSRAGHPTTRRPFLTAS
jgi:hypothetical protein